MDKRGADADNLIKEEYLQGANRLSLCLPHGGGSSLT